MQHKNRIVSREIFRPRGLISSVRPRQQAWLSVSARLLAPRPAGAQTQKQNEVTSWAAGAKLPVNMGTLLAGTKTKNPHVQRRMEERR